MHYQLTYILCFFFFVFLEFESWELVLFLTNSLIGTFFKQQYRISTFFLISDFEILVTWVPLSSNRARLLSFNQWAYSMLEASRSSIEFMIFSILANNPDWFDQWKIRNWIRLMTWAWSNNYKVFHIHLKNEKGSSNR